MKTSTANPQQRYCYKNSAAFKKMEDLACKLILDNQDLNLLSTTKIFKEKAQQAVKDQNSSVLTSLKLKDISTIQTSTKFDLKIQFEKHKNTLELENKKHEKLSATLENTTKEFLEREIHLNLLIFQQTRVLE